MIHFWQKPARITLALAATEGKNKKPPSVGHAEKKNLPPGRFFLIFSYSSSSSAGASSARMEREIRLCS